MCARIETLPQPHRTARQRGVDTLTSPRPDMALRLDHPDAHSMIARMIAEESYDIVQAEGIEMAGYLRHAAHSCPRFR